MVQKGLVAARQVGNVWEYTPAVKRADARRSAWRRFLASAFDGASAPALAFLAREAPLSKKQKVALRAMLDEKGGRR
jgi:predicted transcriptional regulator